MQQDPATILELRREHYGPNTSLNYNPRPLQIVRGEGVWLFDERDRRFLDCVNNVTHLGHGNPEIAEAVGKQLLQLNTNSRYLHGALTQYTQELLATMPAELQVLYMVNSGSEANDLALRISTTARPGASHIVVMGGAYHGHTSSLIDISPYKFWGNGGAGRKPHIHVIPCPDPYRGTHLDGRRAAKAAVAQARAAGGRVAAFIAESVLSCGGQVIMPPGYLQGIYEVMRAEGAVCIADEVQCGFGRVGETFWAFETQGVVPDIVTIGKPMGNGYPVAGLVTTKALANAFSNGMEYFNTYGGSTCQTVAALTVLRCLKRDKLQQHALEVGQYLVSQLRGLQSEFPTMIGDVRGIGLMVGLEIVRDPKTKAHAPVLARWIKNTCKEHGVLLSTDGPYDNVIKFKPPMPFGREHVDLACNCLRQVLSAELTPEVAKSLAEQEAQEWSQTYGPRMARYKANEQDLGLSVHGPHIQQQAVTHLPTIVQFERRPYRPSTYDAPPVLSLAAAGGSSAQLSAAGHTDGIRSRM